MDATFTEPLQLSSTTMGSTDYDADDLAQVIGELEGFSANRIVRGLYKYGPQGLADGRFWDSDFYQFGMLEHTRHRLLAATGSV